MVSVSGRFARSHFGAKIMTMSGLPEIEWFIEKASFPDPAAPLDWVDSIAEHPGYGGGGPLIHPRRGRRFVQEAPPGREDRNGIQRGPSPADGNERYVAVPSFIEVACSFKVTDTDIAAGIRRLGFLVVPMEILRERITGIETTSDDESDDELYDVVQHMRVDITINVFGQSVDHRYELEYEGVVFAELDLVQD